MKIAKVLLATLLLAGSFVATGTVKASDGVITKDEFAPGSYCHMKFPAMEENTLGTNHPDSQERCIGRPHRLLWAVQ